MADGTLEESTRLHRAVARYRVYIDRRVPVKQTVDVAKDLTYETAMETRDAWSNRLELEEPQLMYRMSRSIVLIELTNATEVARILGYGPDFCIERARAAVDRQMQVA